MIYHRLLDFSDRIKQFRVNLHYLGFDYFRLRFRHIKTSINWNWIASKARLLFWILLAILSVSFILIFFYPLAWTGFITNIGGIETRKTLWDWLELLIIPIVLAVGGYLFRKSEVRLTREQFIDDESEKAITNYIDYVEDFLPTSPKKIDQTEVEILKARTQMLLRKLDSERKGLVIRFLYDLSLIKSDNPVIDFRFSELSQLRMANENLSRISLTGSRLDRGNFEGSHLNDANLASCSMIATKFPFANLHKASFDYSIINRGDFYRAKLKNASLIKTVAPNSNFHEADLEGARFRSAYLVRANFSGANLTGASFVNADLRNANLSKTILVGANLRDANLMYANIRGADLTSADLTNAIVTQNQIQSSDEKDGLKMDGIKPRPESPRILTREEIRQEKARLELFLQRNIEEKETPGVFDLIASAESGMQKATQGLERITSATTSLGSVLKENSEKLLKAEAEKIDNLGKKKILDEIGNRLITYAQIINAETDIISTNMQASFYDYGRFSAMLSEIKKEKATAYSEMQKPMQALIQALDFSLAKSYEMQATITRMPGMSTKLIKGKVQAEESLSVLIDEFVHIKYVGISTQSHLAQVYKAQKKVSD